MVSILLYSGIAALLLGALFYSQGIGFVGPAESFMYRDASWIVLGPLISAAGAALIVAWLLVRRRAM